LIFFREIIQTFDISPLQARVAIVEFSDSISLSVALDNYGSKTRLMCAVDEIQYEGMALTSTASTPLRLDRSPPISVFFMLIKNLNQKPGQVFGCTEEAQKRLVMKI